MGYENGDMYMWIWILGTWEYGERDMGMWIWRCGYLYGDMHMGIHIMMGIWIHRYADGYVEIRDVDGGYSHGDMVFGYI